METPKKPGRPAKHGSPMSDKQRAATYRKQRYEAASVAHEDLKGSSTAVLLGGLARQIKASGDPVHADISRDIAAMIINELCDRHKIELSRPSRISLAIASAPAPAAPKPFTDAVLDVMLEADTAKKRESRARTKAKKLPSICDRHETGLTPPRPVSGRKGSIAGGRVSEAKPGTVPTDGDTW